MGLGLGDSIPKHAARELESETKNISSQVGAHRTWARDPACHDLLVSSRAAGA